MNKVKVLLANKPRMLRESLRSIIDRELDLEVVAEEPDLVELLAAVDRTGADVVIVNLPESGEVPGICSHLLYEYPDLLILALSPVKGEAFAYRLTISRSQLNATEKSLLAAIRTQREVQAHRASKLR